MKTLDDLLLEVKQWVKNCPDVTIKYALRVKVQEFCRESWLYQTSISLPLMDNTPNYSLELTDSQVISVKAVLYNDVPIRSARPEDVWVTGVGKGPRSFFFEPPSMVVLVPTPTEVNDDTCLVRLILQTADGSDQIPEVIFREFKEGIVSGAVAMICSMPEQVFTNATVYNMKQMEYMYAISKAKNKRMFGYTSGAQRIRPRSFLYS